MTGPKPREFYCYIIRKLDAGNCWAMECHNTPSEKIDHDFLLIEKSAYDQLQKEVMESHPNNFEGYKKDQELIAKLKKENQP